MKLGAIILAVVIGLFGLVPVVPNKSLVTAQVINVGSAYTTADIKILSSENIPPWRNLTKDKVGQIITVVMSRPLGGIVPGVYIRAEVSLRGDERLAKWYATNIVILEGAGVARKGRKY